MTNLKKKIPASRSWFLRLLQGDSLSLGGKTAARLADSLALIMVVTVPLGLAGSLHLLDYLGPGLGQETGFGILLGLIDDLQQQGRAGLLSLLLLVFVVVMGFRIYCAYVAYFCYGKLTGSGAQQRFPVQTFWLFTGYNLLMLIGIALLFVLLGLVAVGLGKDFSAGYSFAAWQVQAAKLLAMENIPTLVHLPAWLALAVIYTVTGFFHYWLHRLAHEFRLLWLLFHRPHHMPTALVEPITTGVIVAFPFCFLLMFPYILFFSACSKLFSAEPLYLEIILLNLIIHIGNVSAHATALYSMSYKSRLLSFIGHAFGTAHYHYLHHAAEPVYSRHNTNVSNIGGGLFFIWDRLFGTYVKPPAQAPAIGLTGQPPLVQNPLQLLLAGLLQLVYEWRHNRSWGERLAIVFGRSDYSPPLSRDFAVDPKIFQK